MKTFPACAILSCAMLAGCLEPDGVEDPVVFVDMTQEDMAIHEEMSESLDLGEPEDLPVREDSGAVSEDMARDTGVDQDDSPPDLADMAVTSPPEYALLRNFKKVHQPISDFPTPTQVAPSPAQTPGVLYLESRARIDPDFANANGYFPAAFEPLTHVIACGVHVAVQEVRFDEPEMASTSQGYVLPYLDAGLLRVTVRGQSEFELPLSGELVVDGSMLPEACEFAGEVVEAVPFEMTMGIKTEPIPFFSSISARDCGVFGNEPESGSWHARVGWPLGAMLDISVYSEDFSWFYPVNVVPGQPVWLDLYGPEGIDASDEELVQRWPIPATEHALRWGSEMNTLEVADEQDEIIGIEPYFYVPGFFGNPRRLESGQSYGDWHRQSNALMAYAGVLRTRSGAELCAGHFPEGMHPELSITVSSATPDVCTVRALSGFDHEPRQHPNPSTSWFVGEDFVHIEKDGRCELSYAFYLDGSTVPIRTEQFIVDLTDTEGMAEFDRFL